MNIRSHLYIAASLCNTYHHPLKRLNRIGLSFGNILPDITCTFMKYPHTPEVMLSKVMCKIKQTFADINEGIYPTYIETGVITHYLADFFTSVHNEVYGKDRHTHYVYEKNLEKRIMKNSDQCIQGYDIDLDIDHLIENILFLHKEYLKYPSGYERDVKYIQKVCKLYVIALEEKIQYQSAVKMEKLAAAI